MENAHELVNEAIAIIGTLLDIQKRPMKYAAEAELSWKKFDLPKLDGILDELYNLTNPEYANQVNQMLGQEELNYELKVASGL